MRMLAIHVVPVWDDDGDVHVCGTNEVRDDLEDSVIGWANLALVELHGEQHTLLMVDTDG